jgi:hypothetical protein
MNDLCNTVLHATVQLLVDTPNTIQTTKIEMSLVDGSWSSKFTYKSFG